MKLFISCLIIATSLTSLASEHKVQPVNPRLFLEEALLEPITIKKKILTDGSSADCYVIKTKSFPIEHEMGPWSPTKITDGKDKGGIWFEDGKIYDVDGEFVKNIGTFYKDSKWQLYNDDGSIKVTTTKEAFFAAARPNVDPKYQNHVVEGKKEWVEHLVSTYYIPVTPAPLKKSSSLSRGPIGVAFNGVNYDPPAPTHMILKAYTLAPLDDSGGHLNPYAGYHYHAVTGKTKEVKQEDGHTPQIGYIIDGFPLFAHDPEAKDLDECSGHSDETRNYHYHAGTAGSNQIIKGFKGATVQGEKKERKKTKHHHHDDEKPHSHYR